MNTIKKKHYCEQFGNKSSFAYTRKLGILIGAIAFEENTYDGHTLKPQLIQARCRCRAGIEGLISHLKHDHRMIRNCLKGTAGDQINALLAAAAYNMRKWMRLKRQELLFFLFRWFYQRFFLAGKYQRHLIEQKK